MTECSTVTDVFFAAFSLATLLVVAWILGRALKCTD